MNLPLEGSVISFIAGEDRIEGTLTEYSYDFGTGEPTGFYLDNMSQMRYPVSYLDSERFELISVPLDENEVD